MSNKPQQWRNRRALISCPLCAALICGSAAINAAKRFESYDDVSRNAQAIAELSQELPPGKLYASMLCLDGFRFAVAAILGPGASPPAVGMTQVYEANNSQVLPARCPQ